MRYARIEREIIKLVSESPRSPREIVDTFRERGFAVLAVRDTIWEMLDNGKVEVTPDRKLEPATPQRIARAS